MGWQTYIEIDEEDFNHKILEEKGFILDNKDIIKILVYPFQINKDIKIALKYIVNKLISYDIFDFKIYQSY